MAKKKKGGLTGVSAFAMKEFFSSGDGSKAPGTSREDSAREEFDESIADIHASKKRRLNDIVGAPEKFSDGLASGANGAWTTTEREQEQRPAGWVQKYDARGLVSHYTTAEEVPEHLQKCTSVSALRCVESYFRYFSRLFTTPSILFTVLFSAWMSA